MFLFLLSMISVVEARPSLILKNKTTLEFEIYRDYRPYIAEELTIHRSGFSLNDPNGQHMVNAFKAMFGIKYSDADFIKIDPHGYITNRRDNAWQMTYGPALRIDVTF